MEQESMDLDLREIALDRYKNLAMWRNLWTILLFMFGTTIILFFCICIILFINESWLPGAIATIGVIANGIGVRWVVIRRDESVKEEKESYSKLAALCNDSNKAVPFGHKQQEVLDEALKYQKKLRLLGSIR